MLVIASRFALSGRPVSVSAYGSGHINHTYLVECDGGARYQSKIFNPEFMKARNMPTPDWL